MERLPCLISIVLIEDLGLWDPIRSYPFVNLNNLRRPMAMVGTWNIGNSRLAASHTGSVVVIVGFIARHGNITVLCLANHINFPARDRHNFVLEACDDVVRQWYCAQATPKDFRVLGNYWRSVDLKPLSRKVLDFAFMRAKLEMIINDVRKRGN